MKKNKAPGQNEITTDMILEESDKLLKSIVNILNECLNHRKYQVVGLILKRYCHLMTIKTANRKMQLMQFLLDRLRKAIVIRDNRIDIRFSHLLRTILQ